MASASWSPTNLGVANSFGKNCSGPAFEAPHGPLPNDKK